MAKTRRDLQLDDVLESGLNIRVYQATELPSVKLLAEGRCIGLMRCDCGAWFLELTMADGERIAVPTLQITRVALGYSHPSEEGGPVP